MASKSYFLDTLSNGLRVLTVPDSGFSYVLLSLVGKVGRRAEKDSEIGAAHFLEHLFFDGTSKRPSAYDVNKFIEDNGGQKNGITSAENVEYFVKILSARTEIGYEYLSDIFFNSLLRDKDVDKERKVIQQEVAMKKDNPDDLISRLRRSTLYPNQAVGRTIFDEEPNLPNINTKLLRNYLSRVYNSRNYILCTSGNISQTTSLKLASKYFGNLQTGEEVIFSPPIVHSQQTVQNHPGDYKQSKLSISFKGFPAHTKLAILTGLVNIILGGGFSSRLYHRLRNQLHLIYHLICAQEAYSDGGYIFIQTHSKEENLQKVVDEIFQEIKRLLKKGVTSNELEKAKNIYISRFLFSLDTPASRMGFYGNQLLLKNRINEIDYYLNIVNKATAKDLTETAHEIFSDPPKINLISQKTDAITVNA